MATADIFGVAKIFEIGEVITQFICKLLLWSTFVGIGKLTMLRCSLRRREARGLVDTSADIWQGMKLPRSLCEPILRCFPYQLLIATSCMYIVAIAMVKISVLFFYRRIFPSRRFLIILRIVGGFIMCYSTVQLLVFVFECIPIRGAWDPLIQAKCIHVNDMFIAMSAFDVLTGVMTLCLPIPLIWQLHVSKRSKIHLMGIFILGGS